MPRPGGNTVRRTVPIGVLSKLSVSIPFHVGLVLPELRPANPLAGDFARALVAAAGALKARLRAVQREG